VEWLLHGKEGDQCSDPLEHVPDLALTPQVIYYDKSAKSSATIAARDSMSLSHPIPKLRPDLTRGSA